MINLNRYLAMIELLVGVGQAGELSGAAVQVDVAGPEDGQEAHLGLAGFGWRGTRTETLAPRRRLPSSYGKRSRNVSRLVLLYLVRR